MDKNNQGKQDTKLSLKGLGFFVEKDYLVFVFKKTEKLATAVYLITSFFKDDEPLKWTLREKGMYLLSHALTVNDSDAFDRDVSLRIIFSTSLEMISLLGVASGSRLISEMNYTILKKEFEQLINRLRESIELETSDRGFVLSNAFFETDSSVVANKSVVDEAHIVRNQDMRLSQTNGNKGQLSNFNIGQNSARVASSSPYSSATPMSSYKPQVPASLSKVQNPQVGQAKVKDKKDDRRDRILKLLSQGGSLTVKDFVAVISECSEKTIQRELLDMVEKGVLKKEGERRWSRYSLV